jgi:hypothetical protein
MVSRKLLSTPLLLLASGCAAVGPMVDRSYEDAPYAACAELAGGEGASVGQQPVRVGCFDAVARTFSAGQQISQSEHMLSPDGLRITDAAAFRLAAGEGCTGKYFTNFVIEYSAPPAPLRWSRPPTGSAVTSAWTGSRPSPPPSCAAW